MKIKTVNVTKEVTKYESIDGKVFDSIEECNEHEKEFLSQEDIRVCPMCKGKTTIHQDGYYTDDHLGFYSLNSIPKVWHEPIDYTCPECNGKGYQQLKWV